MPQNSTAYNGNQISTASTTYTPNSRAPNHTGHRKRQLHLPLTLQHQLRLHHQFLRNQWLICTLFPQSQACSLLSPLSGYLSTLHALKKTWISNEKQQPFPFFSFSLLKEDGAEKALEKIMVTIHRKAFAFAFLFPIVPTIQSLSKPPSPKKFSQNTHTFTRMLICTVEVSATCLRFSDSFYFGYSADSGYLILHFKWLR